MAEREPGRFHISYVPARIRNRAKTLGTAVPVWQRYDRVCFDKDLMIQSGRPDADFLCPGHPLMDTVVDLMLDRHRELLRSGTVLVDPTDPGTSMRVLFFLEQGIHDMRSTERGGRRAISREVHFCEIDEQGALRGGGSAPYLDYRPPAEAEWERIAPHLSADWLSGQALEDRVVGHAIERLVPRHLKEVRDFREALIDKTRGAVHARLTVEINYWDGQATIYREAERSHRANASVNRMRAEARASDLVERLERRMRELDLERQISATPPVVIGGALVVPAGLLYDSAELTDVIDRRVTEAVAMKAVMQAEIALGNDPSDVSADDLGYDIESHDPREGRLRFIEVKGRLEQRQ